MLEGLQPPAEDKLCPMMKRATKDLADADLKNLIDYIADHRWTATALAKAVTGAGFQASEMQIWKHRSEKCACAR